MFRPALRRSPSSREARSAAVVTPISKKHAVADCALGSDTPMSMRSSMKASAIWSKKRHSFSQNCPKIARLQFA